MSTSGTVSAGDCACQNGGTCADDGTCECPYGSEGEFCQTVGEVLAWSEDAPSQRAEEYKAAITAAGRRLQESGTPPTTPAEESVPAEPSAQEDFSCTVSATIDDVVKMPDDDVDALVLGFVTDQAPQPWTPVSPDQCEWTEDGDGFECAGVAKESSTVEVVPDDVLVYYFKTVDGGEELRPLTVLLKDGALYDKVVYESHAALTPMSDFQKVEYTFKEAGTYSVIFHLGAKDSTAGGVMGGMAYFKPPYVLKATE